MKSIGVVSLYLIFVFFAKLLLFNIFFEEEMVSISIEYSDMIETLLYVALIGLAIVLYKKVKDADEVKSIRSFNAVTTVIIATLLYRIVEDPLLRIEQINNCCDFGKEFLAIDISNIELTVS